MINKEVFKSDLKYTIDNEKYIFNKLDMSDIEDSLDKLKNKLKKFSKFYYFLIYGENYQKVKYHQCLKQVLQIFYPL